MCANQANPDTYDFGPFKLDTTVRALTRDGELVSLAPKAMDMLIVLVRHRGEVLEKDRLMELLWPDTVVEEANLPLNVSALRKALGESPGDRKYIVTVPGRGYKFAGDLRETLPAETSVVIDRYTKASVIVEEETDEDPSTVAATQWRPQSSSSARRWLPAIVAVVLLVGIFGWWLLSSSESNRTPIQSIVVLPFKSLDGSGDEPLPLGLADVLITRLSNLREVVVRPTSAVMRYANVQRNAAEIGRELGVESVLEGSIQQSDGLTRVTVRLLRVSDGASLWADKFDFRSNQIFEVEDTISQRVAERLALALNREAREAIARHDTDNPAAHLLFLKGRTEVEKRTPDGARRSLDFFNEALKIDTRYALAHVGRAESYMTLAVSGTMPPMEAFPRAKESATKALESNPTLAEAYVLLGATEFWYDWDFAGAERDFRKAIEINPNLGLGHQMLGHLLSNLGRHSEGLAEIDRSIALDPVSRISKMTSGQALNFAGNFDEAIARIKRAAELEPGFWIYHLVLGKAYERKGMYSQSISELQTAWEQSAYSPEPKSYLGYTYAVSGDRKKAKEAAEELMRTSSHRYVPPKCVALVYAGLGEREEMFAWLEKAYEGRDGSLAFMKVEQRWDAYRGDPRFAELMRRVGFTP